MLQFAKLGKVLKMFLKILLLLAVSTQIFAFVLQKTYYIPSTYVKLRDIVPNAPYDLTLYEVDPLRFTKKVRAQELMQTLEKHGFTELSSKSRYIKFITKSPIDTSKIINALKDAFKEKYPSIQFTSVEVVPRGYLNTIPQEYEVELPRTFYRTNEGTLSIETLKKRKLFFDYLIDANIDVYHAKHEIQKGEKLSTLNTIKKQIKFDTFKARPISKEQINLTQSKRKLPVDSVIYIRDTEALTLVKRDSMVNVNFTDSGLSISFSARALQNGKLHDIITIEKRDKTKLRVRVIGKNRVEMQN